MYFLLSLLGLNLEGLGRGSANNNRSDRFSSRVSLLCINLKSGVMARIEVLRYIDDDSSGYPAGRSSVFLKGPWSWTHRSEFLAWG